MPKSFTKDSRTNAQTVYYDYQSYVVNNITYLKFIGTHTGFTSVVNRRQYRSFSGTKTVGYYEKIKANGYVPTLACSDLGYTTTAIDHQYVVRNTSGLITSVRQKTSIPSQEGWLNKSNDLVGIATGKVRMAMVDQDVNLGIMMGESAKTSNMIYQTAKRVASALMFIKRGQLLRAVAAVGASPTHRTRSQARRLDERLDMLRLQNRIVYKDSKGRAVLNLSPAEIHQYWLEIRYGWRPLLYDIHGSMMTLAKANVEKAYRPIITIKKSASSSRPYTNSSGSVTGTVNEVAKAWIHYRVSNPLLGAANQIGLLNPLSIAWELLPFSFVADWFVNIGDYLTQLTAFAGVEILDSGTSRKSTFDGVIKNNGTGDDRDWGTTNSYEYYRRPGISAIPTLRLKDNPLTAMHLLDAIALIRQVTR